MLLAAYVTLMNRTAIVASPVSYSQACDTSSKAADNRTPNRSG